MRTLGIRVHDDDEAALARLVVVVKERAGPGIRVSEGDAVRWALHTCVAALATASAVESTEGDDREQAVQEHE